MEFAGSVDSPIAPDAWRLVGDGSDSFDVAVFITHLSGTFGSPWRIRCSPSAFNLGAEPFDTLRFSLANLPKYLGEAVISGNPRRTGYFGRVAVTSARGTCTLDRLLETDDLQKQSIRDGGFVISHVAEWVPTKGPLSVES